ncbi:pentatricopeptide repeat-containing protein At3g53360, mitochondrial-like isoform X2 [Ananas comosus]|uniref:Pentatricopeptide repeat-containing protein At3g53360, mitochondrial-like isoform X2 n=1 Tax=Ananas comosus TaxID=4615 RepID=A0A6P5GJ50_ANACO|nr:pentatricopeptide repeat-containing protein At3g53360, mitochondrial-like isoform X2 [Ananas comosus]
MSSVSCVASAIRPAASQNSLLHKLGSSLLYSKPHRLRRALNLFDEMPHRGPVPVLTSQLHTLAVAAAPKPFALSSSVAACAKLRAARPGAQLHARVVVSGHGSNPVVGTALVDLYAKVGRLDSASAVFRSCPAKDAIMVNSMVSGFVGFGAREAALALFVDAMRGFDFQPTEFSFSCLAKACSEMERGIGEQIHGCVVKAGFDACCFVATSLLDMYASFGDVENMEIILGSVLNPDIALHNAVIGGYSRNGYNEVAVEYFRKVILVGLEPNDCTLSGVLKACGGLKSLRIGSMIHAAVEKSRFRGDLVVNTALIDMYMKCGDVAEGSKVFDWMYERNTVSYNALIFGYGQNGNSDEAVALYVDMKRQSLVLDVATFVALLSSCRGHEWSLFVHVIKHGFGSDFMVNNALLDALVKVGSTKDALEFFDKMGEKTVVSWTTIISGLSHRGLHSDSIELFKTMCSTEICPNSFTFSSVLNSCGYLLYLELGRCIHGASLKHGLMDEFIGSSLLDMYAKCGALHYARRLFDETINKGIVSWNTMITSYARHGYGHEALFLYAEMPRYNVDPNPITFISLLTACSRCGLVEKGVQLFNGMLLKHGIVPHMEHYACLVDLFGRAGLLDRAKLLISEMPFEADASVWAVFLAACKIHGKWDDAENARRNIETSSWKKPGLSWVQIEGIA